MFGQHMHFDVVRCVTVSEPLRLTSFGRIKDGIALFPRSQSCVRTAYASLLLDLYIPSCHLIKKALASLAESQFLSLVKHSLALKVKKYLLVLQGKEIAQPTPLRALIYSMVYYGRSAAYWHSFNAVTALPFPLLHSQ
jgi:hypothetical protein